MTFVLLTYKVYVPTVPLLLIFKHRPSGRIALQTSCYLFPHMGRFWLTTPVLWHSSRIRSGYNYDAMTPDQVLLIRERFRNWYTADWDYGLTTIYFFCGAIGLLAIYQISTQRRTSDRPAIVTDTPPSTLDRFVAGVRYLTSRQFKIKIGSSEFYLQSLGVIFLICSIFTFNMGLLLAVRPYHWPNDEMGSAQPIATRAAWISIAIMPFMITFATKVNPVTFLVQVSYEKLQVFHRWTAVFMYITALVHALTCIQKSFEKGDMSITWNEGSYFWTGVVALVCQTWLIAFSWKSIRNPFYEFFKKMHFLCSTVFMVFLFLHCNFRLSSWDYFWATLAIYASSWLTRVFKSLFYNSDLFGRPATIEQLSDNMVLVSIRVPSRMKWKPGQHVYVRFLSGGVGLHALTSHPFSILSLSNAKDGEKKLDLVLRSYGGITKRLYDLAEGKPSVSTRVIADGPYGGIPISMRSFDAVYLFAGGTGTTMVLPVLMDLVNGFESGMACKHVEFILALRGNDPPTWMKDQLIHAQAVAEHHKIILHIHVTRDAAEPIVLPSPNKFSKIEEDETIKSESSSYQVANELDVKTRNGRPDIRSIIRQGVATQTGRIGIATCGPNSLLYDIRNTVAQCELELMNGIGTCKEIYLHTEHYDW